MDKLSYSDLCKMEYKLIFDYYDQPLSFIAEVKSKNYLFYFISDEKWFITLVDNDVANKLNEVRDLKPLYEYLYPKNKIYVVTFDFDNKTVKLVPISKDKDAETYLPPLNDPITFDYEREIAITDKTDLLSFL